MERPHLLKLQKLFVNGCSRVDKAENARSFEDTERARTIKALIKNLCQLTEVFDPVRTWLFAAFVIIREFNLQFALFHTPKRIKK